MSDANIENFLQMKAVAVFGASSDKDSEGFKLVKKLARAKFSVYPINPRIAKVGTMRCFGTLDDLAGTPQMLVISLIPEATLEVLKVGSSHGVRHFWIQPGAESDEVLTYISEHGLHAMTYENLLDHLGK